MKSLGMYVALGGILSIVFSFVNSNISILMWIDNWGETIGWAIRIGLVIIGGTLFLTKPKEQKKDAEKKED